MASRGCIRFGPVPAAYPDLVTTNEGPWVGREAEAHVIAELLTRLDHDRSGTALLVAGEPGIGKSRLLRELSAAGEARGHLVFSGRAAEFDAELPFGVWAKALDDRLQVTDAGRLRELAAGAAADLAVVLPAFDRVAPGRRRHELRQERYRAYRAVRELLSMLATDVPVVIVLDDVQWADPASVELLCHVLAHRPRGPVLLALGFRPAQLPSRLSTAMAETERALDARRLDLAALAVPAARQLVGAQVSDAAFERLYRESGGNPFFLTQLLRASFAGQSPSGAAGRISNVPGPVRAVLATELSSLSDASLVLLRGAAVAGDPFQVRLAATAADVPESVALDLVDELLRFQLVVPGSFADEFVFRHPIVRAAVAELTSTSWRAGAHARLATFLAAQGSSTSAQAPHVERSAAVGDTAAVAVLVDAGDTSAPRAPALAARWYRAALRLLPERADTEAQRVQLMIALATALGDAGHLEESRLALSQLLDRLGAGDPARVPVLAFCAGVEHLLGRHRAAEARLTSALRVLPDMDSIDAVHLLVELASGAGFTNRYDEMLRWARQAHEGATRLGQRALAVAAAGQIALATYFLGLPAGAAMDQAAAATDDLDDGELAGRLDIGLWIGWSEAVLERHEAAIRHCRRVVDVSRATGQGAVLLVTMTAQAWSLIRLGRLDEADELLRGAIEAGYLAPNVFLSVAVGLSSVVATCQGRYDAALRAGEESVRLAGSADPGLIAGMSGLYCAIPLIEMGRDRRAREVLLAMSGGGPELQTSRSGYAAAHEVLTRAELALRDLDAAEEWARRGEAAIAGSDLPGEVAVARRATAAVALARRDTRRAVEIALEAAALADEACAPIEAGRCRILGARSLAAAGEKARAVGELERAVKDLGHIGADGYRAHAVRELRRLGRRVPRGTAGEAAVDDALGKLAEPVRWGTLTRSQQAVVALVAQGLSNPEVAERLYLSPHTVKRHLADAMWKLGITSRRELRAMTDRNS